MREEAVGREVSRWSNGRKREHEGKGAKKRGEREEGGRVRKEAQTLVSMYASKQEHASGEKSGTHGKVKVLLSARALNFEESLGEVDVDGTMKSHDQFAVLGRWKRCGPTVRRGSDPLLEQ
jgi:hypothetical protein